MTFRPNTRRVYTSWGKAARDARTWGAQTGRKHRVQRYRQWWIVRRTDKRTGPFESWAKDLREVRMTVVLDSHSGVSCRT